MEQQLTGFRVSAPAPPNVGAILIANSERRRPATQDSLISDPTANGNNAISRLGRALIRGAEQGLRTDQPLGPGQQTLQTGRDLGLFPRAAETRPLLPLMLNEAFFRGAGATLDAAGRALDATTRGVGAFGGQVVRELGGSETSARKAERDLRLLSHLTGLLLPTGPAASTSSIARSARVQARNRLPGSRPIPSTSIGRPAVRLPRGRVNARGRQRTSSLQEAKSVFNEVVQTGQSVVGKLFREDIGDITIDFGTVGNPNKGFKKGRGLAKILAKRASEGLDAEDFVLNALPQVVSQGKLVRLYGPANGRRADIKLGNDVAVFSLFRRVLTGSGKKDVRETWLLTGWRQD